MLMNPDGTPVQGSQENPNPRRVTNNVNYDAFPDLSPDGKKIVFDSNRHGLGIVSPVAGYVRRSCLREL